jgi:hypothetical protein
LRVSANTGAGVQVRGAARVDAAGTVSPLDLGQGTLVLADNGGAGLSLQQLLVAEGSGGPPASTWSGVVVRASGGSGLELVAGSALKLRRSSLWANGRHGVHLTTSAGFIPGGAGANTGNQLTRLDLGAAGDPGRNVLQDATHPNALKGVCLELSAGGSTGGLLPLAGNVFATGGSNVDCAQLAGSLPATGDCLALGPLGDVGRNPKNDFDLGLCTVP